jgi:hypothetical protein
LNLPWFPSHVLTSRRSTVEAPRAVGCRKVMSAFLLRSGGTRTRGIPITDDPMAYDSGKRLLLYALVKRLGDAVRRNDQSTR